MISVILATRDNERDLVRTLAALVPAAADGAVRDVVVVDGGSRDDTEKVADVAGCTFMAAGPDLGARLRAGAARARGDWLLFLRPDCVLEAGWHHEARAFVDTLERRGDTSARAGAFTHAVDAFGLRARFAEQARRARQSVLGGARPDQGLLVHRRLYGAIGLHPDGARSDVVLLARLGRRVVQLRPRAFVRGRAV